MRLIAVAVLAGCGGSASDFRSHAITAPAVFGCETSIDAGVPCDPCPGNVGSTQTDYPSGPEGIPVPLSDGGLEFVLSFRSCQCPAKAGATRIGVVWRACPPIPAGFAGYPATTCAEVAKEFSALCAGN